MILHPCLQIRITDNVETLSFGEYAITLDIGVYHPVSVMTGLTVPKSKAATYFMPVIALWQLTCKLLRLSDLFGRFYQP